MSIQLILQALLKANELYELPSLYTGTETARTMIVTPDVLAAVSFPLPDTEEGRRLGEFRYWLDGFSELSQISVAEDPFKKPQDTMLARVGPVEAEFWSIRITAPEDTPGIRCLGAFAEKDKFIALMWDCRELIGNNFSEEVEAAQAMWRDLFGIEPPLSGDTLDDYLTNYYSV